MKKEEILLQAIGMLPDEMAVQDVTEELLEGAASIEKKANARRFLHKCSYVLAAAACFAVIITSLFFTGRQDIHQPDDINNDGTGILTGESKNDSVNSTGNSEKDNNIKLFVYSDGGSTEQQKSNSEDKSYNDTVRKEVLYGKTVKLPALKLAQYSSASKKTKETEYIVFSMDRDFYFTVPGNAGRTYIFNEKSGKKHFVNGEEALCKAGNKVYFDISGGETGKETANIENWDKEGRKVIAYTDIYLKDKKDIKPAGRFYIGKKEKNKSVKDKEGDVYYGFFEIKNGD